MQTSQSEKKEERIVIRCEPSFIERATRIANARYAGNRSYMVRLAIDQFLDGKEQEISEVTAIDAQNVEAA